MSKAVKRITIIESLENGSNKGLTDFIPKPIAVGDFRKRKAI